MLVFEIQDGSIIQVLPFLFVQTALYKLTNYVKIDNIVYGT